MLIIIQNKVYLRKIIIIIIMIKSDKNIDVCAAKSKLCIAERDSSW